ncbi:MAG TPA: 50S ribosomal protein L4 [Thermodesulfobacteriota bacterium]|nr:50S ribosomal protein L4 [Thermodesulfobacteriota bacterium]
MQADLLNKEGKSVSRVELDKDIYEGEVNENLFYEVVKMQLANRRRGTASTKDRSEVSGGGRKPWRQKGTGRARSGSSRSPIWRHGGVVFGPRPRDYSYKVPRKVRKEAIKSALRLRARDGNLKVFDALAFDEPKTRKAVELFRNSGLANALIVVDGENTFLKLASRNLKDFKVIDVGGINVYDMLNYENLVFTKSSLEKVEAMVR